MNSSKLAISVYITDDQYNTLRVSEKTTAGKVCSMVARKRNLKKSIKYALFLQHGEGHETRLRSDQSIVKTIDRVRRTTDAVRIALKPAELSSDESGSEEEDLFQATAVDGALGDAQGGKAGYLSKMGDVRRAWCDRWFEIQNGELLYRTKPGARTKGTIALRHAVITSTPGLGACTFDISMPDSPRVFRLRAQSHADASAWISALRAHSEAVGESRVLENIDQWLVDIESAVSAADFARIEEFVDIDSLITHRDPAVMSVFRRFLRERNRKDLLRVLQFCIDTRDYAASAPADRAAQRASLRPKYVAADAKEKLPGISGFVVSTEDREACGDEFFAQLRQQCVDLLDMSYAGFIKTPLFSNLLFRIPYRADVAAIMLGAGNKSNGDASAKHEPSAAKKDARARRTGSKHMRIEPISGSDLSDIFNSPKSPDTKAAKPGPSARRGGARPANALSLGEPVAAGRAASGSRGVPAAAAAKPKKSKRAAKKKWARSIFGDSDEEDDLFGGTKPSPEQAPKPPKKIPQKKKNGAGKGAGKGAGSTMAKATRSAASGSSIFGEDDDEGGLFGGPAVAKPVAAKATKPGRKASLGLGDDDLGADLGEFLEADDLFGADDGGDDEDSKIDDALDGLKL